MIEPTPDLHAADGHVADTHAVHHPGHDEGLHAAHHPAIVLSDVTVGYDGRAALTDVSVTVAAGTILAVFGPNGGGKSTFLKVVAGLLKPWSGRVEVLGAEPGGAARRIAYVPQAEQVDWEFPVSVWDVVVMGRYARLGPFRRPGAADHRAVADALELVGMTPQAQTQIGRLSGGQRRRAFLARAIAADPDLYLLDEPVTGVDPTTQEELMRILDAEARRGKTVIATTHDLASAAQHFQDVLAINRTVIAQGRSDLVLDRAVLSRTYGGHLLVVSGETLLVDDAHHHDEPPGHEIHFHEGPTDERDGAGMIDALVAPLQYEFGVRALVAAALVGLVCAVVGSYMVLRGLAFMGDAISHAAFPGVVMAYLFGGSLYLGGAIAAVATALGIGWISRRAHLRSDTIIGVLFAGMFGLGVAIYSAIPNYVGDLFGFLFGDVLGIGLGDLIGLAVLGGIVLVVIWALWKEFLFATFDPLGAAASGLNVNGLDYLFLGLIALTIVVSIQAVGIILVVAMLTTPAATAQLLTARFGRLMAIAIAIGIASGIAGIYVSFWFNVASGASIVLIQTAIFLLALALGPRNGLLRRRARMRAEA